MDDQDLSIVTLLATMNAASILTSDPVKLDGTPLDDQERALLGEARFVHLTAARDLLALDVDASS